MSAARRREAVQHVRQQLGVFGFLILAWTGAFSEELFFRGHFFTTLRNLLGGSGAALTATIVATVALFAPGHGYQGWVGVVDTGFYGGLTLTLLYVWRRQLTPCFVAHAMLEHAGDRSDLSVVLIAPRRRRAA